MLNCLCFLFLFYFILFYLFIFYVLFFAVKTDTKLTLHHSRNIFIIELTKIKFKIWKGYIFEKFLPLFLGGGGGIPVFTQ